MRRNAYQTPKSFLSFLADYKNMYVSKVAEIDVKASQVLMGLDKLLKVSRGRTNIKCCNFFKYI